MYLQEYQRRLNDSEERNKDLISDTKLLSARIKNFRKSTSRSEGKQMCNYFQFEERANSHYYAFNFPHKTDKKRTFY